MRGLSAEGRQIVSADTDVVVSADAGTAGSGSEPGAGAERLQGVFQTAAYIGLECRWRERSRRC